MSINQSAHSQPTKQNLLEGKSEEKQKDTRAHLGLILQVHIQTCSSDAVVLFLRYVLGWRVHHLPVTCPPGVGPVWGRNTIVIVCPSKHYRVSHACYRVAVAVLSCTTIHTFHQASSQEASGALGGDGLERWWTPPPSPPPGQLEPGFQPWLLASWSALHQQDKHLSTPDLTTPVASHLTTHNSRTEQQDPQLTL